MDEQIGSDVFRDGTERDHAQVHQLKARFGAALDAERPAAVHTATTWALGSGLRADAERIEEALAAPRGAPVEHGFFALLSALGISAA